MASLIVSLEFRDLTSLASTACTVDPVTNDLASARQKKALVTESRWSQE